MRERRRRTTLERLTVELVAGIADDPMADEIARWLTDSRRFREFAATNLDKIRKKLRGATDPESRRDVRAELRVAQLLLADRRIELSFEAYGSTRGGPDFTVAFSGERPFNLEVTRIRGAPGAVAFGGPLLPKLRQLPPSVPNALLVAIEGDRADAFDVVAAVRTLRSRADEKDEAFFVARGFEGTRQFYDRFLRLGAVIVCCEPAAGDARATLWINGSARISVPERAMRACIAGLRAD